ncbi:MAG: T9SS type A sorting domain-containing protein [Chlorobi bacterium]|nr:T9SS type A sorting domain-containing protein [Chlorobiota bacterium]
MKRKFTLIVLLAFLSFGINAQTLDNWTITTSAVTVAQETSATYVTEGTYAAKVTWTSTTSQDVNSDAFNVTEGAIYTYTLDVYDNTNAGRVRMIIVFSDGTYVYSSVYSVDQASVQTLSITDTVPTGATTAYIRLRFYDESAGWAGSATVWVDNANYNEGGANLITNAGFENWTAAPTGPVITGISSTPWSPESTETVNVSATITDDVSVAGATLYWSLTSPVTNADNGIPMAVTTGDVYGTSTAIPAQADGATVYYIIGAADGDANTTVSDEKSYTVVDPVAHTISEIQTPADIAVTDSSVYEGVKVSTTGVVYAAASKGFFIQDGDGAWNGIYVYDSQNTPTLGDEVTVSGFVKEYYNLTEINLTAYAVNSSGNALPAATVVSTLDANKEDYEGVLIQVKGATCTNADAGYGQWEVNDGSGALLIDDVMYGYTPTANVKYNVTGAATYSYGNVTLLPRDADDVQDATAINDLNKLGISVFPNPSNGVININVKNNYNLEVFDITGRVINTRTLTGNTSIELNTAGVYFLRFSNENGSHTQKLIVK